MRLIRFGEKEDEKPGISIDGIRYDCSHHFKDWNRDFFVNGGIEQIKEICNKEVQILPKVDEDERWANPIARPGMIMCIGLNYVDHALESGMEIPKEPIIFMKASNTISGPYDPVAIPPKSQKVDWEVELGIVLGQDISYASSEAEANDAIFGYCVVNDLSERFFQVEKGGQWTKGKSCPGFCPVGPFLVDKSEIENINDLRMMLSVNGQMMQNSSTKNMIFKPSYLVWYLSQFMQLEAGDLISTGTPPGVGMGMAPPQFLNQGDSVELSIAGLGRQVQSFT